MVVFRRAVVILVTGTLSYAGATVAQTGPGGDPPGRVGRLAFLQGTVSFHDNQQTDWAPALVNTPVTSGDAIWTEPNARSEISIAGTRVRMDSASQLDMLALDDTMTRMQLDQGRIDIKTFTYDTKQPYEIVTPRGTISLQQQGDYYVEAGTTQDPTRLGVRQGAAQIQTVNGQVMAVRAGEVAEVSGDGSAPQLHKIATAPPPMPTYWAERDRQVAYEQPPQYLGAGVTGYEDLNYYGSWSNDPEYGQVWAARSVPDGWTPYSTGRWNYEQTYGWTWVDEQPWGFAPYHYGRWAQRNNRWFWVPPERQQRAVYAPALVAFLGGTELGIAIGAQNRAPVGWFPLGPREAYVPSYTSNRDYYRRLNASARVQQQVMDDRWQYAQRREAVADNRQQFSLMNRRFATVVPAEDFARSRPVERVAIKVAADKIATAPVAFVAAPPSPTTSIRAEQGRGNNNAGPNNAARPNDPRANDGRPNDGRPNDRNAQGRPNDNDQANVPAMPTRFANMQAIKPEPERQKAPGPQFVPRANVTANTAVEPGKPAEAGKAAEPGKAAESANRMVEPGKGPLPMLVPRNASAPPPAKIEGERKPVQGQQATAPATAPEANRPATPPQANAPSNPPGTPPRPGEANRPEPQRPGQANLPPVRDRNEHRPDAPRTGDAQRNEPNRAEPTRPGQPPAVTPPATTQAAQPPRPAEPNRPEQRPEPPKPQNQANQPQRPEPPKPAPSQAQPQQAQPHKAAPAPKPADAPKPPVANAPAPQAPHQATPPAPPPQRERETRAAPPQPQHQAPPAAPPPQQVQRPAPPPPVQHAAPPPQQAHAPAPPPPQQVQRPAAPPAPPPQVHAPAPPQQAQAPRPAPPPQQAQAPHPAPAPAQAPPQQQKPQGPQKDDKK
jgi:hypothetical protein